MTETLMLLPPSRGLAGRWIEQCRAKLLVLLCGTAGSLQCIIHSYQVSPCHIYVPGAVLDCGSSVGGASGGAVGVSVVSKSVVCLLTVRMHLGFFPSIQ